jgi:hypothetical protein
VKFSKYLESLIYNEITTPKIDVASIDVNRLGAWESNLIFDFFKDNIDNNNMPELLDDNEAEKLIMNKFNDQKKANTIKKILQDLKTGNKYFITKDTNLNELFFVVGNKLYYLVLKPTDPYGITFDEVTSLNDLEAPKYTTNNVMANKDNSSRLFNMIAAIIKKERPGWKDSVFYFDPKREGKEIDSVYSLIKIIYEISLCLSYCSDIDESQKNRENYLLKCKTNIKKHLTVFRNSVLIKIKNLFPPIITNDKNGIGEKIVDHLLFNKEMPALKKYAYTFDNKYNRIVHQSYPEVESIIETIIIRNIIYKKIINQMFGEGVN